jgi:hypothetical protein
MATSPSHAKIRIRVIILNAILPRYYCANTEQKSAEHKNTTIEYCRHVQAYALHVSRLNISWACTLVLLKVRHAQLFIRIILSLPEVKY